MPLYQYKARDKNGAAIEAKVKRATAEEVRRKIILQGHTPVSIKKLGLLHYDLLDFKQNTIKLTKKHAALFCRQFSYMYGAGISVTEALRIMADQTNGKAMKDLLEELCRDIEKGAAMWESMADSAAFPEFLVTMAEAGEMSGRTEETFKRLSVYYEKEEELSESIRSAFSYPALISVMLMGVIGAALIFLLPNYADIYAANSAELPVYTEVLLNFSGFLSQNYFLILPIAALLLLLLILYAQTNGGRLIFTKILLRLPLFGSVYKKSYTLKFVQVMAMLFDSGVTVDRALSMTKKVLQNPYTALAMDGIIADVEKGTSLGAAVSAADIFEELAVGMLRVGEESGRLPEVLKKCAEYLEKDTEVLLEKSSKMIEPVMLLVVGLILGFVMMAVMLPSFDLGNVIGG